MRRNASRTLLFDIHTGDWDDELLRAARRSARGAAATSCRRRACAAKRRSTASRVPIAGIAGRPAGRAVRPGVLRARAGEEHLRHRLLPAAEHRRRQAVASRNNLLTTVAWKRDERHRLRARGQRVHRRRGRAVAARRPADHPQRRRTSRRSRARWPTTAACTSCPRSRVWARRTGTRTRAAPCSALTRGATGGHLARAALEVDRATERGRARRDAEGRGHHAVRAARRRRRDRERPADAVPGRRARRAGRAAEGARDHRARRRLPRRSRGGLLAKRRRRPRQLAGRPALRAVAAGRARASLRSGWEKAVARAKSWA